MIFVKELYHVPVASLQSRYLKGDENLAKI